MGVKVPLTPSTNSIDFMRTQQRSIRKEHKLSMNMRRLLSLHRLPLSRIYMHYLVVYNTYLIQKSCPEWV